MKEHLLDKRVVTRALQEGLLDKDAYQRMLDELPDLSHKVQTAAEAAQLEAASQAAAAARAAAAQPVEHSSYGARSELTDDDLSDEDDDDLDDEDDEDDDEEEEEAQAGEAKVEGETPEGGGNPVSDTIEMERPRIPGSYNPDF